MPKRVNCHLLVFRSTLSWKSNMKFIPLLFILDIRREHIEYSKTSLGMKPCRHSWSDGKEIGACRPELLKRYHDQDQNTLEICKKVGRIIMCMKTPIFGIQLKSYCTWQNLKLIFKRFDVNLALSICLQNLNRSIKWYYKWLNYYISHFQMIQHWQVTSLYFRCYRLFHLDLLVQNHQAYLTWFCQKEQWAVERESVEKTGASTIGWEVTLRPFAPVARARPVRLKWAQPTGQGCRGAGRSVGPPPWLCVLCMDVYVWCIFKWWQLWVIWK